MRGGRSLKLTTFELFVFLFLRSLFSTPRIPHADQLFLLLLRVDDVRIKLSASLCFSFARLTFSPPFLLAVRSNPHLHHSLPRSRPNPHRLSTLRATHEGKIFLRTSATPSSTSQHHRRAAVFQSSFRHGVAFVRPSIFSIRLQPSRADLPLVSLCAEIQGRLP